MANLDNALQQLRTERSRAQSEIEKLDQAISVIESFKRFRNISENQPEANNIGSFSTEDGAGAKGAMGKGWEGIAFSGGRENNWLGTREAHHVGISPQEDRRCSKGEVGEVQSSEEGGLEPAGPITRIVLHSCPSEEYRQLCCLSSMPFVEACAPVHSSGRLTFPASIGWPVRPPR